MAESNFSAPPQRVFPLPTNPSGFRASNADTSAPPLYPASYANYSSFSTYGSAAYGHLHAGPFRSPLPEPHGVPFQYMHQSQYHQMSHHGGPYADERYAPSAGLYQNGPNAATVPNLNPGHFHSMHMTGSPHTNSAESRNHGDLALMMESPMSNDVSNYSLPPYSQLSSPPLPGFGQFPGRRPGSLMPIAPTPPSRFGSGVIQSEVQVRGPVRGVHAGNLNTPRHILSPSRRTSHDRPQQHNSQVPGGPDRRSLPFLSANSRHTDRSVSPRTSNRRSFDRYATDLPLSSVFETEEAVSRARLHRLRQQRQRNLANRGSEYRSRAYTGDSNTPSVGQMQALKDKLRHFLPSELPKDASNTCDICQKDYSSKHVLPTEDEEVAIQLPCKHVFGEHCINTWFETCKTHKNKITCPMCRKFLIEPMRPSTVLTSAMPEMMAFFSRGSDISQAERQFIEQMVVSELGHT